MHDLPRIKSCDESKPLKCNAEQLRSCLRTIAHQIPREKLVFVCIGSDRSTGDSLGPLVGSGLLRSGFTEVIGSLDAPCDASNLIQRIVDIPEDRVVIAIDACLGHASTVGYYLVHDKPLQPAESVGTVLPAVGHYSIAAVVNANGPKPYWTLATTSLYDVIRQAKEITEAIVLTFARDY